MSDNLEEKGFLSGKFENWSSEPVPNGWADIESVLEEDRRNRRSFAYWVVPSALLVSLVSVYLGYRAGHVPATTRPEAPISALKMPAEKAPQKPNRAVPSADIQKNSPDISSALESENPGTNDPAAEIEDLTLSVRDSKNNSRPRSNKAAKRMLFSVIASSGNAEVKQGKQTTDANGGQSAPITGKGRTAAAGPEEFNQNSVAESDNAIGVMPSPASAVPLLELEPKTPVLRLAEIRPGEPTYRILPPLPLKNKKQYFRFFAGASAGYASRSMLLNQAESYNLLRVKSLNQAAHSWFAQLEAGMQTALHPRLSLISALQLGRFEQTTELENTSKTPDRYIVSKNDSLSFGLSPERTYVQETRKQTVFYSNLEIGIKPIIIKELQSGPFVSLLLWAVLMQKYSDNGTGSAAPEQPGAAYAAGYKFGYQHLLAGRWNIQIFAAEMPQQILLQSRGLRISPRFFGAGVQCLLQ